MILAVMELRSGHIAAGLERLRREVHGGADGSRGGLGRLAWLPHQGRHQTWDAPRLGPMHGKLHKELVATLAAIVAGEPVAGAAARRAGNVEPVDTVTAPALDSRQLVTATAASAPGGGVLLTTGPPLPATSARVRAAEAALQHVVFARTVAGLNFLPPGTFLGLAAALKRLGDADRLQRLVELAEAQASAGLTALAEPEDESGAVAGVVQPGGTRLVDPLSSTTAAAAALAPVPAPWEERTERRSPRGLVPPPKWRRVVGALVAATVEALELRVREWREAAAAASRKRGLAAAPVAPVDASELAAAERRVVGRARELLARVVVEFDGIEDGTSGGRGREDSVVAGGIVGRGREDGGPEAVAAADAVVAAGVMTSSFNRVLAMAQTDRDDFLAVLEEMQRRGVAQDAAT
ncbi:hypothetical protein HK405_001426, partial [Cladochytrium tenue]